MSTVTALDPQNLPTPKVEEWKYTNLARALPEGLNPEAEPQEIVIHKTRGQISEQPEHILFTGLNNTRHTPKIKIHIEDGAQATVIEAHEGEGAYWKNMAVEIELGQNARLNHVRLQNDTIEAVQTSNVHIRAAQDSVYDGFSLNKGGKLTRHEIHAILEGKNAEVTFNGVNLLKGKQHGDTTILIEHAAPHGRSNQFYRTVLDEEARGVFQGKVHVHKIAQKTDGYQLSNAILLSEKAEMDTKPELEIYADDVKCSHGATTGQLDEEPLFYLRTRGLNEGQARMLMIRAFVDEVADKVGDEETRNKIKEVCRAWLQNVL